MNCGDMNEILPLYLTGELDAARAAGLRGHLDECGACAAGFKQQRECDAELREAILADGIDVAALNHRIRERISAGERTRSRWPLAVAAAIAAVALTAGIGYRTIHKPVTAILCVHAAEDHHGEVVDKQPRKWLSNPEQIEALARRNGVASLIPAAIASGGYHLDRGRACRLEGAVFVHLVYSNGANEFSLFLSSRDAKPLAGDIRDRANGRAIYAASHGQEHLSYFRNGDLTAVVVTNQSEAATLSIARSASSVL